MVPAYLLMGLQMGQSGLLLSRRAGRGPITGPTGEARTYLMVSWVGQVGQGAYFWAYGREMGLLPGPWVGQRA